jgi:hypothetical protein
MRRSLSIKSRPQNIGSVDSVYYGLQERYFTDKDAKNPVQVKKWDEVDTKYYKLKVVFIAVMSIRCRVIKQSL